VPQHHSDLFSTALEEAGIPHAYVIFKEAHGWQKPGNNIASAYLVEAFLHQHLKGGVVEAPTPVDAAFTDMKFVRGAEYFSEFAGFLEEWGGIGYGRIVENVRKRVERVERQYLYPLKETLSAPLIPYINPALFKFRAWFLHLMAS